MKPFAAYLRSLNPRLPRSVQTLQAGALANAFGNGLAIPFLFIYLHNVRGIDLGTAGLIVGTNAAVGLVAGPLLGMLIDRIGGRRTLALSLLFMAAGFGAYPFVQVAWQGFLASAVAGIGNGGFWPSQSSLIARLTPPEQRHSAFAVQRVMMNLGIGLGGLTGGLIATTDDPTTFTILFLLDAATFLVFIGALAFVPEPHQAAARAVGERAGSYRDVLRNRVFVGVLALNVVFITAGMAQLETFPVYAKNEAAVSERGIGVIWLVNTLVIVLAQLPIARALEGTRRMATLLGLGVVWALAWLLVPVGGLLGGEAGFLLLAVGLAVFAVGECLHGTVQAPLVADLADHRLIGRYMAMSAFSWGIGFTVGPAVGGFVLKSAPHVWWLAAAGVCLAAGLAALVLERALPNDVRRTPDARRPPPEPSHGAEPVPALD